MDNDKRKNTIFAVVIGVAIIVILIIVWVVKVIGSKGETGGLETKDDGTIITTDVSDVTDLGFPKKLYSDFSENFYDSMVVISPTCGSTAKAKNIKVEGDVYTFDIVYCNVTYSVELTNDNDKNYSFIIKQGDEQLVTYNSANKGKTYLAAYTIYKYLPMEMSTSDGQKYTITQKNTSNPLELEIGTDNCGDEEKKNKAIESAKEVLEYTGYNPEDFTYIAPNYCDREE